MSKVFVVRIRTGIGLTPVEESTLKSLGILSKNSAKVFSSSDSLLRMLNKVRYLLTWGEVSEESLSVLTKLKPNTKVFHLNSPRKGYGRKGVKMPFSKKGAYGYRGDKINDLLMRMLPDG